jgi:hypothetical protein
LILILGVLLVLSLVAGILYPDDPGDRSARIRRAIVTMASFSVTLVVADFVIAMVLYGAERATIEPIFALAVLQLSAVPISVGERVAGLFHPRRTPFWAFVGMSICLTWSGLLYLILARGAGTPVPEVAAIIEFTLPGIVGGLAWYAFLPRRDSNVGRIFE